MSALLAAALALSASPVAPKREDEPRKRWTILAERVYTGAGRTLENGMVFVNGGKVATVSVSPDESSSNETLRVYAVTPGLIDASVRITSGSYSVEQTSEVEPGARVAESLDPFAIEWNRQLRSGVTTVLVNPPDFNVIGGRGVVLKTGGPDSIAARTVRADAVLRGAMGQQPSFFNHPAFPRPNDFFSRRPTTRMGVEWEWRHAMYEAAASKRDETRAFAGSDQLLAVLRGELTLSIQAWTTQDIRTAVFLKEEIEREGLGQPRMFLDAAAESWRDPELLVRSKTAVVLPPFPPNGRTNEAAFMPWNCARQLIDQGVPVALSSHGLPEIENRLPMQAGYAMRGGLTFDEALAAVTITPARLLGIDKRVGTLEVGKDADLVLWSGPPFEASSRVVGVVLDGVLQVDPRTRP